MRDRTLIDGVNVCREYILFPYDQIPKGSTIVMYGAGDIGKILYEQINQLRYCHVLSFIDRAASTIDFGADMPPCVTPEAITRLDFDYCVLAVTKGANLISENLEALGIDGDKIIHLTGQNIIQMSMTRFDKEKQSSEHELRTMYKIYQEDRDEEEIYQKCNHLIKAEKISLERQNLLQWYPFRENCSMLQINSDYGELTRFFCKTFQTVVVLEPNQWKRDITKVRTSSCSNLITISKFEDIQRKHFDYIFIGGDQGGNPKFLDKISDYLNENGTIILAGDNKYSLRHWADVAEITKRGKTFHGIDRNVIQNWCAQNLPNHRINCYYPYPSWDCPDRIYSDAYLPEFSSLRGYRYTHMELNILYDALELSGATGKITDSYLLFLEPNNKKQNGFVYINYKRKRRPEFQASTSICLRDDSFIVTKTALNEKSISHLKKLLESKKWLEEAYKEFQILPVYEAGLDAVEFPYYPGYSLDNFLWLCHEDESLFLKTIRRYCQKMRAISEQFVEEFQICEEFRNIFGEISYRGVAMKYANIDAIFDNIITDNDAWYMFDYEWVFSFPVPLNYPIYRGIEVFLRKYRQYISSDLVEKIWDISEISSEDTKTFQKMNDKLWIYFTADNENRASFRK